jgi:hypothetical protein
VTFIHEDPEFPELLAIVQRHLADQGVTLSEALVEKDYWVTHTLWSLHHLGLEVWFKGGTSLSKGFGLIQRFSEDLDLKIEGGRYALPKVTNWKSDKPGRIAERRAFFEAIAGLAVPGLSLRLDPESMDEKCQGAEIQAIYPGIHLAALEHSMKPFVLLEVGEARVRPFLDRPLSSFVHDYLQEAGRLEDYEDNRPASVRCIHPMVTLIEKLDAISSRFRRGKDASDFVRHYEDAAHIILEASRLPALAEYEGPSLLIKDMLAEKQIRWAPSADDPAFNSAGDDRWADIQATHGAIRGMFWGPRIELTEATAVIRAWIASMEG